MSTTSDALINAANSENAAIFTYGVIGAYVSASRRQTVADQLAAHRARRAELDRAIVASQGNPPQSAAGYILPVKVTDPVSSARATLAAETDCAVAYRAILEQADTGDARRIGVDGLTDAAKSIAYWRAALNISPVTSAFPGSSS